MYQVPDQSGRRFVVTGANSGTGREVVKRVAAAGADVVMAVRSPEKGEAAREDILRGCPSGIVEVRVLDLANLASVRSFAEGILDDDAPLNVLVNNAGVMVPPHRMTTDDGFELQFGTNFLGPFALTCLLLPRILESSAPRVLAMSSGTAAWGRIRFEDLQSERSYRPRRAYAQSKLADLLASRHLAALSKQRGWGLLAAAAHPGYTRTNLQTAGRNLGRATPRQPAKRTFLPSQSVETGAEPLLFAATDPAAVNDGYYGPGGRLGLVGPTRPTQFPRTARDLQLAARLWEAAEQLTGVRAPS
ncbi:MAG: SDR family oxidoreductase [Bifidobacteriaceae bacterium]|jgi:NAD(P)-dependent dehydrogenase (short-subunit alcohol dehydrogenase family)|nr:SDR family oxidoreductase [Bifidobacteriaceae bacterium]